MKQLFLRTVLPVTALALAACGGDSGGNATGTLNLSITDAPIDHAERVVVEFTGVTVKPQGGQEIVFTFDAPRQIDLLALQGGTTQQLLDGVTLDAGEYNWLRLGVNAGRTASDSFIELEDGGLHPLYIPSGNETGLKIVRGFTVPANASADFTIDFDLRKSVVDPSASNMPYVLKPVLRMVDNTEVGDIAGTVDASYATATGCAPAVYVFEGANIVADDVGSASEPVASALVTMNDGTGVFEYRVAFLTAGEYTVALTCEADDDAPDADDDITFIATASVSVSAEETATANF